MPIPLVDLPPTIDQSNHIEVILQEEQVPHSEEHIYLFLTNDINSICVLESEEDLFQGNLTNHITPTIKSNAEILDQSVTSELDKYFTYLSDNYQQSIKKINILKNSFSFVNFEDVKVELSPTKSISFKFLFPENLKINISKPLVEIDDLQANQVILTVIKDGKHLFTSVKTVSEVLEGIDKLSR